MADAVRDLATLLTMFADNHGNDITPQDGRDLIVSNYNWVNKQTPATVIYFNGNVGIGDFSGINPDGSLHVHTGTAGAVTANSAADDLVVENSGDGGISILVPDANNANLYFASLSDNIGALINWNYNSGLMNIASNKAGGQLSFSTAVGVEAMRIYSDQKVGIGTGATAPDGTLHVHTATAGAVTAHADADEGVFENSSSGGISIIVPDASDANIVLGSASDNMGALFRWHYNGNFLLIGTNKAGASQIFQTGNGTEAMRIDSSQNVVIGHTTADGLLRLVDNGASYTTLSVDNYSDNHVNYAPLLQLRRSYNNTKGTLTETIDTCVLAQIQVYGVDTGSNFDIGAQMTFKQDGAAGVRVPTNAIFTTCSATAENANQLVLHNGNGVGLIGVAAPVASKLQVGADIYPGTDDTYYLGKNDDDTPFAWKGVILKDTTDGKYYRIESINGAVTATDLTD